MAESHSGPAILQARQYKARSGRKFRDEEVGGQALDARVAWVAEVSGSDAAQDVRTAPGPEGAHGGLSRTHAVARGADVEDLVGGVN